ncbi:glycosyltransferase family 2 protein [Nocardioides coralli]|uniref:glycosyltransferase family 2 protein n=1 Tax=Nocardioides coralli TaxID=2872154 RepID=UPI001CA45DCE|nr:glycosyltransferase family 2 protein [Nocardioides coralli]QZY28027.1 glycosyltransferase family 2 protein [Nocardioides coralli]
MVRAAVVVPTYNEAGVVGEVVSGLRQLFDLVICVDDGSSDESAHMAKAEGAIVLRHPVNLGQGAALRTGFEFALGLPDVTHVVTFDADGQHDPRDAAAMLSTARTTGVDVVLGTRGAERVPGQSFLRWLVLKAALRMSQVTSGLLLTDTHNGLRVLNRRALKSMVLTQRGMAHASEIEHIIGRNRLSWAEHSVTIAYTAYSQRKGQSSLNAFNIVYDLVTARLQRS